MSSGSARPVVLARRDRRRARSASRCATAARGFKPGKPKPRGADGGFGLFLVERMASRWGIDTRDGTRVWFELELTPGGH